MNFPFLDAALIFVSALLFLQAGVFSGLRWMPARSLLVPALRAGVQLALMAGVLAFVFESRSVFLGMGLLAAMALAGVQVVRARSGVPGDEWQRGDWVDLTLVLLGVTGVASVGLAVVSSDAESWLRIAVPFSGLILGNSLSAFSVSIERLRSSLRSHRTAIEARLLTGASVEEAVRPWVSAALRAGLTPILGAMSGAGLVSLPGALSGQLLAGGDPIPAVKLQLLVLGAICLLSGFASALLLKLWLRRRIDHGREALISEVFA